MGRSGGLPAETFWLPTRMRDRREAILRIESCIFRFFRLMVDDDEICVYVCGAMEWKMW